ncbi:hypothetical protein C464_06210 [Halorubrum coriense DSM 10284]|uniref:Uncharacterized protein n=1 Tax=Halorubrum coriense DSM 10284 TaxID=1227466 RepID=M0EQ10_9EURY|nr:HK97 gp10 family phage protein [Halorubrum coriense]ELZ48982.1 hypothetical protein C464_06210 [Halorubrum coriense DSM 10284]QRG24123.1 neck protein [Halorubrum virus Humcor1]
MDTDFRWVRGSDPPVMQETLDEFIAALGEELEDAIDRLMGDVLQTVQRLVNVDTGQLRASYETEVREAMEAAFGLVIEGIVESDVEYAPFQEFLDTGKPHVAPAIEEHRGALEDEGTKAWNNAVRRVS